MRGLCSNGVKAVALELIPEFERARRILDRLAR